ncbi:MAG: hypothetical protein ACK5RK_12340 [Betaproteobacteria bacterium]
MTAVVLHEVAGRQRLGLKGAAAPEFLRARGLVVPERVNHWTEVDGLLVARLGMTEFLLEAQTLTPGPSPADAGGGSKPTLARISGRGWREAPGEGKEPAALGPASPEARLAALAAALATQVAEATPDLYPVLRADCALELSGPRANELLLQSCNVNFAPLARAATAIAGPLALTQMVGVSVTVLPQRGGDDAIRYRIWCDPSFGPYLVSTLQDIATDINAEG